MIVTGIVIITVTTITTAGNLIRKNPGLSAGIFSRPRIDAYGQ
jgi:hypothetical protein